MDQELKLSMSNLCHSISNLQNKAWMKLNLLCEINHENGHGVVEINYEMAVNWYKKAAMQGNRCAFKAIQELHPQELIYKALKNSFKLLVKKKKIYFIEKMKMLFILTIIY